MDEEDSGAGDGDGAPKAAALRCSFCNKKQDAVKKLIAGPSVFICDECVGICIDILVEDEVLADLFSHEESLLADARSAIDAAKELSGQQMFRPAAMLLRMATAQTMEALGVRPPVTDPRRDYTQTIQHLLVTLPACHGILHDDDRARLLSRISLEGARITLADVESAKEAVERLVQSGHEQLAERRSHYSRKPPTEEA